MAFGKCKKDKDGKKLLNGKLGKAVKEILKRPHVNFIQEETPQQRVKRRYEPEIIGSERPASMIYPERRGRGKRRGYDMGENPSDLIRMRKKKDYDWDEY